jgi:nucleotide-binding universal stress UspA family protein
MSNDTIAAKVMACVDHSSYATSICDYAVWAAARLSAPLEFVHVLDRHPEVAADRDYSGAIGLGAREQLLNDLASLDERRSKIAQERGRLLLEDLKLRAQQSGIAAPMGRQRHGELAESLSELESEVRLVVLGKRGEAGDAAPEHLGRNLERVIRALHRPILVVPHAFTAPAQILIAFDGSATTRKGVEMIAASPIFRGLRCHVAMVGAATPEHKQQIDWARGVLGNAGIEVSASLTAGQPDALLINMMAERSCDLLVMGAYGHSRIRHLLVGSTTTTMIRVLEKPVLLLR